jgi:hypothetical protein
MPDHLPDPADLAVGRRGCGDREPGGAYLCVPLSAEGSPLEAFLVDPPVPVDPRALGLSAIGVTLHQHGGATHVFDIVGREHYPAVAGFLEEARRMGISRRISRDADFARLTPASRLVLLHEHADVANAPAFPIRRACPCRRPEHLADGFAAMCARLWWDEPLDGAHHRLAIFASFPIARVEVVRDPAGGRHRATLEGARKAHVEVCEADR